MSITMTTIFYARLISYLLAVAVILLTYNVIALHSEIYENDHIEHLNLIRLEMMNDLYESENRTRSLVESEVTSIKAEYIRKDEIGINPKDIRQLKFPDSPFLDAANDPE